MLCRWLPRTGLPSTAWKLRWRSWTLPTARAILRHGYQAVADNLPNDPRVHEQKGSKKIFFKNFMDARVNYVILPLAQFMMPPEQAAKASAEGYLLGTIMHEMAHGLGPATRAPQPEKCRFAKPSARSTVVWKKRKPMWSACSA